MQTTLNILVIGFSLIGLAGFLAYRRWGWAAITAAPIPMVLGHSSLTVLYLSGFVLYRETVSAEAGLLIAGCVLAFTALFIAGYKVADGRPIAIRKPFPFPPNLVVCALGFGALIAGMLSLWFSVSSGMLTSDIGGSRRALLSEGMMLAPFYVRWPTNYIAPAGLLAFSLGVLLPGKRSILALCSMYCGLIGFGLVSVSAVGRHGVMLALAGAAFTVALARAAWRGYRISTAEKIGGGIVGFGLAVYVFILPALRITEHNRFSQTMEVMNADESELMSQINATFPGDVGFTIQSVAVYLSHQAVMLTRHMELTPVGPYWGSFQFMYLTKYLRPGATTQREIKDIMYGQAELVGLFGNVWGTASRDALIDFGYFGAMVQFAVFGFAGGVALKKAIGRQSVGWGLICVPIWVWAFYALNVSAIAVASYEVAAVIFVVAGVLWRNVTYSAAVPKAQTRPARQRQGRGSELSEVVTARQLT